MDRNLGALETANSSTDDVAYGDLHQWGRAADGHEKRSSVTTSTLSSSDDPEHDDFISVHSSPYDWRSPQNDNLWQGVTGTNNPCPDGYRLPTEVEWQAEIDTWSNPDATGAFASPLNLPMAGYRTSGYGALSYVGLIGYYWSSSLDGPRSRLMIFDSGTAQMISAGRANAHSVRCIKD